jgi:hypothetical protein
MKMKRYKLLLIALLIVGCDKEEEGCTDSNAINFNPNATVDDNTCEYSVHDGFPDFESICGMDEFGNPTENIGDGICGLCLGQIEYEGSLGESGESGGIHVQPAQYSLSSLYPNPFNPTTSMELALPEAGNISILVYNTLYEIVDTLVNRHMDATSYSIVWDSSKFPSGYYRIVADFGDVECFQNAYKPLDCAGIVGGDTVEDECGECGGDGAEDSEVALWGECYSIEETTDLVRMDLFYYGYRTISPDIGSLTNLTTLNLSHNQLIELPEEICDIYSNLSEFDVSDNHICGDLPSCLTAEDIGEQYCD